MHEHLRRRREISEESDVLGRLILCEQLYGFDWGETTGKRLFLMGEDEQTWV